MNVMCSLGIPCCKYHERDGRREYATDPQVTPGHRVRFFIPKTRRGSGGEVRSATGGQVPLVPGIPSLENQSQAKLQNPRVCTGSRYGAKGWVRRYQS